LPLAPRPPLCATAAAAAAPIVAADWHHPRAARDSRLAGG
jgi:hypothetical protein